MSQNAIKLEGIGKQYHIGRKQGGHRSLQDVVTDTFVSPFRRAGRLLRGQAMTAADLDQSFWALRDVSLEVQHGGIVGIVGRNGAGKSTLLKILSRITEPTEGCGEIYGRVGSLLEVGTGFHPELSGRENLFLNGAILGMRKAEIERKFDEIVAFAEIDKFIDTPVKHYSSGMYVRLAFAVAAHLEPEILLVDEVLSVGDSAFQKKCLGKMNEVARAGRTVVLVSHQMNQMRRLCDRVVWVDGGKTRMIGSGHDVVRAYEGAMYAGDRSRGLQRGTGTKAQFLQWELDTLPGEERHTLRNLGAVTAKFKVEVAEPTRNAQHGVALFNADRQLICAHAAQNLILKPGVHVFTHSFPSL